MKKVLIISFLSSILFISTGFAGGEPGEFMFWGVGARALGMGNASVGVVNDAFAGYWNPAGLGVIDRTELGTFHSILWEDTSFSFISYAHPMLHNGTWGVNVTRLYSGNAEKRDINNINIGSFNHSQMAIGISYANNVYKGLYYGLTGKYATLSLDTHSMNNFTMDTGLYFASNRIMTLGANLQNIISMTSGDTEDKLPVAFRIGGGYHILGDKLLLAMDLGHNAFTEKFNAYSIGLESKFLSNAFSFRLGRNQEELTTGVGIEFMDFNFDYALAMHDMGPSQRVSFNVRFGDIVDNKLIIEPKPAREPGLKQDNNSNQTPDSQQTPTTVVIAEHKPAQIKIIDEASQEEFRRLYQSGMDAYRRGLYTRSLERFTSAQAIDTTDPDVTTYLDRLVLVVPIVPQNIANDKTSQLLRQGIRYFIEGNGDNAVKTIAYAMSIEPDNFTISRLLNRIEEKTGIKAENTKPVSGMSMVDQKLYDSLISFRKKDYSKVIDLCEEVLVLEPKNVMAYKRLGSAFYALGEKEKGMNNWRKALELKPDPKLEEMIQKLPK